MSISSCYLDESSDEGSSELCYTVAGWIGGDDSFLDLSFGWSDFLKRNDLRYFKTSECEGGVEEFAKYRDDPRDLQKPLSPLEKKRLTVVKTEAIDVLVKERDISGIGTVLMLPDYERFKREYPDHSIPNPYFLCGQVTLVAAGQLVNQFLKDHPREDLLVRPIFDSHEIYSGRMKQVFDSFKEKNPRSSKNLLAPHYEDDTRYKALQAADLLAYEARRLLVRTEYAPRFVNNRAWDRMKEMVELIYKLDYRTICILAKATRPDEIPIDPAFKDGKIID